MPVHLQPAYAGRVRTPGPLPHADEAARTVLSLPIHPELTDADVGRVAAAVHESLAAVRA